MCTPAPVTNDTASLGDFARQQRHGAVRHSKVVVTNDDVLAYRGPLPRAVLSGRSNADEVLDAIWRFGAEHTPEETETAVHDWYDEQLSVIREATLDVRKMSSVRPANLEPDYSRYEDDEDRRRLMADDKFNRMANEKEQQTIEKKLDAIRHVREVLIGVRMGLERRRMRYKWFDLYAIENEGRIED